MVHRTVMNGGFREPCQALLLGVRGQRRVRSSGSSKHLQRQIATSRLLFESTEVGGEICQGALDEPVKERKRETEPVNIWQCLRIPAHPWCNLLLNQKISPIFLFFSLLFPLINVPLSLSSTPQVNGFWLSRSFIICKLLYNPQNKY